MVASEKARSTNLNCEVVAMVKHDQSEPLVDVTYCECHSNVETILSVEHYKKVHIPKFLVFAVMFCSFSLSYLQNLFSDSNNVLIVSLEKLVI